MEPMDAVDREEPESKRVRDQNGKIDGGHRGALILLAAATTFAPFAAARFGMRGFVCAYAIGAVAWPFARSIRLPLGSTIAIAVALRLAVAFHAPLLSGDVYRYMFDGRTLASGVNPYRVLPDDPRVNHRDIPTIYPPHAEIVFALVHNLTMWRLLLIAADVAIIVIVDEPVAYALFPPAILEGSWSAHVEILAALLLLVAWRRRSAVAAACAVGMKIIPIAAILSFRPNRRFVAIFLLVLILPAIPFLLTGPLMPGMRDYATRWIFNSPAYDAAFAIVDSLHAKAVWTSIKDPLHLEFASQFVYAHLYSDFLARVLLALIAIALIVRWRRDPVASIGALLLCSPAIHPWYWLVAAPLAMRRTPWIALALCAPASYLLYGGASKWLVYALCYAPPLIARIRLSATASSAAESPRAALRLRTERDTPRA
jgi:hypothetical protein